MIKRQKDGVAAALGGIGKENPFVSTGRAGMFDTDYLLHLNNAAYLSHAEYARWELCAYNGLMESMFKNKINFVVGGTAVRFRQEIGFMRKFEVHTFLAKLDERHLWLYHTFRYPPSGKDPGRIKAQVVCQGIAIQGRNVIDPRIFLKEKVGIDAHIVDELSVDSPADQSEEAVMAHLMDSYLDLEGAFKDATAMDDEKLLGPKKLSKE
jgi:acyl-CoA thioesterase FadM